MTKIEQFAKEQMGITLTLFQVNVLKKWAVDAGATVVAGKRMGISTCRKVWYAYMQDATKDLATEIAEEF